jgi:predicted amidohydrolase
MEVEVFISKQPADRQSILSDIHTTIIENDKSVIAEVGSMMGKEMILYKGKGVFKYGLASVKQYISLHLMPIYSSKTLHTKYRTLLPLANFQKGCINFLNENEMPIKIVRDLIIECASFDLAKMREEYLKSRKAKD